MLRLLSAWSLLLCSVRGAGAVAEDRRSRSERIRSESLIPPSSSFSCEVGVAVGEQDWPIPFKRKPLDTDDTDKYVAECKEACKDQNMPACFVQFGKTSAACMSYQEVNSKAQGCLYFHEDAKGCSHCPGQCVQGMVKSQKWWPGFNFTACREKCQSGINAGFVHFNYYFGGPLVQTCGCLAAAPTGASALATPYLTCFMGTRESSTSIVRAQEENGAPTDGAHNEPPTATEPSEEGTSGKAHKCPKN